MGIIAEVMSTHIPINPPYTLNTHLCSSRRSLMIYNSPDSICLCCVCLLEPVAPQSEPSPRPGPVRPGLLGPGGSAAAGLLFHLSVGELQLCFSLMPVTFY